MKTLVINERTCMRCGNPTRNCTCQSTTTNLSVSEKKDSAMNMNHELQHHYEVAKAVGATDAVAEVYAREQFRDGAEITTNAEELDQSQGLEPIDIDWVANSVFASPCGGCPDEAEATNQDHLVPTEIDWTANSIFASKE